MHAQVGSGATTHYPNLLPAALVGAGYAVSSAVPGSAAAAMSNTASSAGYVLKIQNLPEGTAKYDIVKVCAPRMPGPPPCLRLSHFSCMLGVLRSRLTLCRCLGTESPTARFDGCCRARSCGFNLTL